MPQILALEWDDAEARVAVADVRRGSVVLEQAFAVSLPNVRPGGAAAAEAAAGPMSLSGEHDLGAIGRRISEALAVRGIRRGKTLVAVGSREYRTEKSDAAAGAAGRIAGTGAISGGTGI